MRVNSIVIVIFGQYNFKPLLAKFMHHSTRDFSSVLVKTGGGPIFPRFARLVYHEGLFLARHKFYWLFEQLLYFDVYHTVHLVKLLPNIDEWGVYCR